MAGEVSSANTRVRELGVFLRNVRPEQIKWGIVWIYKISGNSPGLVNTVHVRENVDQRTPFSVRVFTNIIVNKSCSDADNVKHCPLVTSLFFIQTNWNGSTQPNENQIWCCELRINGSSAAFGCLQLRPRWMERMLPELGKLRMRALAIPGTHQSGAISSPRIWDRIYVYSDCQEESVYTQLLYGIRFLDLRPGAVPSKDSPYNGYEYFIVHGHRYQSLSSILWDVKHFLDAFEKEVVIVDFHEFPEGFDEQDAYLGLEKLVNEILGIDTLSEDDTSPGEMTLDEVIKRGQRAIVTFEKNEYLIFKFLPGVNHIWANTDQLSNLREHLRKNQKYRPPDQFFSAMAQTTAQGVWKIRYDWLKSGIRGLAHRDNLEISSWYAHDEEMRKDANIIAMDYFASSDIVEICKSINRERMKDPEGSNRRIYR